MQKPSQKQIDRAQEIIAETLPMPIGYRIAIWPLSSTDKLKTAELEKFPTLAAAGKGGFVTQSKEQTEKETKGADRGILCYIGAGAFNGTTDYDKDAPVVGQVVLFHRYAGHRQEFPAGSGDIFHFCNDEDILGKHEGNAYA